MIAARKTILGSDHMISIEAASASIRDHHLGCLGLMKAPRHAEKASYLHVV